MANFKTKTTILLLIFQVAISKPDKNTSRPVYEVIEPPRTDEKKPPNTPGLPYGNPLAGNSLQNAKLHAQNQQAMFNAERVRQHRAQLQRWTKAPQQVDSYMKAYHESQESHQLALEQEQAKLKDKKSSNKRQENLKHSKGPDPMKITKEDAVTKAEIVRNHRSYGSVEYQQYLDPRRYKTVFVSPGSTYDQGVSIKPNGLTYLETTEPTKLYTEAIASKTQYLYPKQYSEMHNYQSSNDIAALNALLTKTPQEQLTEFKAMLQTNSQTKDSSETPIDYYFYLKGHKDNQNLEHYAEVPTYATYTREPEVKDHTPITEAIDDIEDPSKHTTITYSVPTAQTFVSSTGNYFTAGQSIEPELNQPKPTYQALVYENPLHISPTKGEAKEVFLHQTAQPTGVQHLNENGVGVSAYSDDDVSIQGRARRSTLDTEPFITKTDYNNTVNETMPTPEEWKGRRNLHKRRPYYDDYEIDMPNGHNHDYPYYDYDDDDYDSMDTDDTDESLNYKQPYLPPRRIKGDDLQPSYSKNNYKLYNFWNDPPRFASTVKDLSTSYGVPYNLYSPEPSNEYPEHFSNHGSHSEPIYVFTESQLKRLIGHHNLNIQHLDVFQLGHEKKKPHRPRKHRRRPHHIPKNLKKNLFKIHKLTGL
ncbi:hypothetical protein O3G_MSEX015315 [Manduca sexta]|nr:hypothetical protein O3G_MSEX015315 [Manduca sexta]